VGNPIRMSDTPAEIRTPSPVLGQHTDEVLAATGWPTRNLQNAAE
jgi:crotonobetainyl-CoA:carnitine CoA-transferase CaiB-like acyl-CoA transferase